MVVMDGSKKRGIKSYDEVIVAGRCDGNDDNNDDSIIKKKMSS